MMGIVMRQDIKPPPFKIENCCDPAIYMLYVLTSYICYVLLNNKHISLLLHLCMSHILVYGFYH
jgi:hypothetical protein